MPPLSLTRFPVLAARRRLGVGLRRLLLPLAGVLSVSAASFTAATAQDVVLASAGPRFLSARKAGEAPVEIDVRSSVLLRRMVSLNLRQPTLGTVLAEIERQAGIRFMYSPAALPADRPVRLRADSITVAAALTELLMDADLDVLLSRGDQIALVKRMAVVPAADSAAIEGRITDKGSSAPLAGATVLIDETRQGATTNSEGRYRIVGVAPGTYTLRVRWIGYTAATTQVTVEEGQDATADFALERSPLKLDEVVVTGTIVPTEVKAIPTPISVISDSDIALQQPHTVQELFRQAVPGAVSWNNAAYPNLTSFSVRGASTLAANSGQMKVLVDGIEAAYPTQVGVDPNSIARIEVIRGPQAAAIYGSDAIGGVIQIFTKRGDQGLTRPQISAQAAIGATQTPYASFNSVLRQHYAASVRGGGADVSYNLGAGYSHIADYLPNGEISAQSNPSIYGGVHLTHGFIFIDVSGRYYAQNDPNVFNPALSRTGFTFFSKPFYQPAQIQNQSLGARIGVTPTPWWQSTLTFGIDRSLIETVQREPRLTTPGDTLLTLVNQSQAKNRIGFNTSVQGSLTPGLTATFTGGFDHYSMPATLWFTGGALNTTGGIRNAPGYSFGISRSVTNNTGYFAQAQLSFGDVLFLTSGLRAEHNSNFGDSLGTPLSPRVGLSYVQAVGETTLKLRGSWGRAIRAPSAGQKFAIVQTTSVTLANPGLGPERQKGWDAGVDAVFGDRGTLSVSYYDQTADDLIQFVLLQSGSPSTYQWQNVGRVKNTGVEVEGTLGMGPVALKAQYGYARARIEQLAASYAGDLREGDQVLQTPQHTAGASLAVAPYSGTTLSAGLTYAGSWSQYDYVAEYACFGGTGPCRPGPGFRSYIIEYPSLVKVNATLSQQINPLVSGFVSVDNLTNNEDFEASNLNPVMGRTTTVGIRLQY